MGKLGVREKSLIHQTPLQKTTPIATPGFGTGFVPFGNIEPDDPEQGVPGGIYNFGQSTIVNPSAGTLWQYRAKTTATSGYPGDGYILWDNATQTSAANLIFAHITDDGLDIDLLLATVASGNELIIQDANDSLNFQKWTVSGSPTNTNPGTSTSYWTIPVTLVSSGGTGTTGFPNNHQIIVFRPGAGGGSTTTNVTNNYIITADPVDDPEPSAAPMANFGGVPNSGLANMAAHTVKANITGSSAVPVDSSLSAILDAELTSTQGSIIYRGASSWAALGPGSSGYILVTNGSGANPSWAPGGGITSNWATIVDLDFSALSNQTLGTDTTFVVGTDVNGNNLTWTKANSTNDSTAMAVVNGSGLVIQPKTTGTYLDTTRTATSLSLDLPTVITNYYIGMPIQVWIYISADNIANSSEGLGIAIDNIGGSTALECQAFMVRFKNGSGTKVTRYTGNGLNAVVALNDPSANLDNTDRVMMMSFPLGRFNGNAFFGKGAYSSGWPAYSALIPFGRTTSASTGSNLGLSADLVTGLPMKLVIWGQSNTTAKSYTVARLRIDYQVR